MSAVSRPKYTLEEYLELDRNSDERLEYWDGEVFSMSGVSKEHDQIEGNLHFHLRSHLAGRNCRVFLANMRIKVPSLSPYRYGDISALGGPAAFRTDRWRGSLDQPQLDYRSPLSFD
jgi:Uma2 family endonuclease